MVRSNEIKGGGTDCLSEHLVDVETGERGYIITGNEAYLEPYEHGLAVVNISATSWFVCWLMQPSELGKLAELNRRLDSKIALSQSNVQARKRGFRIGTIASHGRQSENAKWMRCDQFWTR